MRFQGRAKSIGPMWFQQNKKPNPGGYQPASRWSALPRQKNVSGGHALLIVRDEFRTGYSLIGLLASRARRRFTGIAIIKLWTAETEGTIIKRYLRLFPCV